MRWQRVLRVVMLIVALATAAGVALTFRRQSDSPPPKGITRVDPKATAETARGRMTQTTGMKIPGFVDFERSLSYPDGSVKFFKPTLTTTRAGRDFRVHGNEAQMGADQAHVSIHGDVVLTASDGLEAHTQEATYSSGEQIVRAPKHVAFTRGTLSGSGEGMTYDQRRDVIWLLDKANIVIAPEKGKDPGARIVAGAAGLARRDNYMRFERGFSATRDNRIMSADNALAYLTESGKAVKSLELRANSRIVMTGSDEGGLQSMTSRDMNLTYGPDGESIQRALLAGGSVIQMAGPGGRPGRRIAGETVDVTLGPDNEVTALVARDKVQLTLPAEKDTPERIIRAARMEGSGEPGKGLTSATFTDDVEFREARPENRIRVARSRTLTVALTQGGGVDDARFSGAAQFEDGTLRARAQNARYLVGQGQLALTGAVGPQAPQVQDERITVDAAAIDLTFDGPKMKAREKVQSVMKPARTAQAPPPAQGGPVLPAQPAPRAAGAAKPAPTVPGMLKDDQPAYVTGAALDYDGANDKAIYTGGARLWQGDTAISADSITIDEKTGDLYASGQVRSTFVLEQVDSKTQEKKKVPTIASGQDMHYEDAMHRATYTTNAHVNGPQGDLRAVKIELYLVPGGGSLERAEAYEDVNLRSDARTATGARMTYFAKDERYLMTGAPVRTVDEECRETTGKTLTFYRSTDTVSVDGNQELRTLSRNGGTCSQAPAPPK